MKRFLSFALVAALIGLVSIPVSACPGMKSCPAGAKCEDGKAKADAKEATPETGKTTGSETKSAAVDATGAGVATPQAAVEHK